MKINKLTSIRASLIGYSALMIGLMTILSFYTLGIMDRYQKQVSSMFENHIYLKHIEEEMVALDDHLIGFLTTKNSTDLNNYIIGSENIGTLFDDYYAASIVHNKLYMKNIHNLVDQYLVEADLAITFKRQRNVQEYSKHYDRTKKIQSFVFEYINEMNREQMTLNSEVYLDLVRQINFLQKTTGVIIADLIIFSLLIIYMLSRRMLKPINALYTSAEAISKGDFTTEDVHIASDDEFRLLANAFNNMKNSIVRYIEALKLKAETEAKLKDEQMKNLKMAYLLDNAKLSALQSQINPHFLFNTINAGVQLSVIEKATRTGQFLETMSRLFRYSLRNEHDHCTLGDELSNIRDYYELLRMRFRDRIKFQFHVDQRTLDTVMPAMILQPIVENSYIHGLSGLEDGGTISLTTTLKGDYVEVCISDDGVGMSKDIIQDILNPSDETEGIGVRNVKTRLELYYHEKQLFDMYSGQGVTTVIKLPVKGREHE